MTDNNFTLAIYPAFRPKNQAFVRPHAQREAEWNMMKLMLNTSLTYLQENLQKMCAPGTLRIDYREHDFVLLFSSSRMRWTRHCKEAQTVHDALRHLREVPHLCYELIAVGSFANEQDRWGEDSGILEITERVKVCL